MSDLLPKVNAGSNHQHVIFEILKDGETVKEPFTSACFADLKYYSLDAANEPCNREFNQVKFYPWASKSHVLDMKKWVQEWMDVALEIPFVKRRVLEYTGFTHNVVEPSLREIDYDKYILIDFTVPVDEPFVVCQLLRVPQEYPNRLNLFKHLIELGYDKWLAFITSLYFIDSLDRPYMTGHAPMNTLDMAWVQAFYKDPSVAKSVCNQYRSNVIGGSYDDRDYNIDQFIQQMLTKDPIRHSVAVYGSLREGMGNHTLIRDLKDRGCAKGGMPAFANIPAKLFDTGYGFPALVPSTIHKTLKFEIYGVNDEGLASLDRLEGYPDMYDRAKVLIAGQMCWVYYQKEVQDNYTEVGHGDWARYLRSVA